MRRGQVHPRSWDEAIRAVQKDMLELARTVPLSDEQDRILTAAFVRCEDLKARKYLAFIATNRELAGKYGVSLRTITNWRREGCPFVKGQTRVLGWLARRRYAPAGARAKFGKRLSDRRRHSFFKDGFQAMRADLLDLRQRHKLAGEPLPDWLRRMPFRTR